MVSGKQQAKAVFLKLIKEKHEPKLYKSIYIRRQPVGRVGLVGGGRGSMCGEVVGALLWIAKEFEWMSVDFLYLDLHFMIHIGND